MRKKEYRTVEVIYCDSCGKKIGKKKVELYQGDFCSAECKKYFKNRKQKLL